MNISDGQFYGSNNTFVYSEMSSYARLQLLKSDSKQTTGQINLKLKQDLKFLRRYLLLISLYIVSEAPSGKNLKTKDSHIS